MGRNEIFLPNRLIMKYTALGLLILVPVTILITGCMTANPAQGFSQSSNGEQVIIVDALLPLTGSYSSFGEMAKASLITANDDINRYYQVIGSSRRVNVIIHDTGSNPATALTLVKQVHENGRRIILGHMTSAEIAVVKNYTDMNGMVVLDAGSTSPALSITGDSIYRLISDDSAQGQVMGIWLRKNNISAIVPVWRGDIWGDGLLNSTSSAFSRQNGIILKGVRFDSNAKEFSAPVASLDVLTGDAINKYGAERIGVYLIGFDESTEILSEASGKTNLSRVHWFGCDGNTGIASLTGSSPTTLFATQINMTGTVWGLANIDPLSGPKARIKERLGSEPASGPIALYDALWVVMDVLNDVPPDVNQAEIETALVHHLNTYDGESGSLKTNSAGDRSLASYDLMEVTGSSLGSSWKKTAHVNIWPDGREEIS